MDAFFQALGVWALQQGPGYLAAMVEGLAIVFLFKRLEASQESLRRSLEERIKERLAAEERAYKVAVDRTAELERLTNWVQRSNR